MHDNTHQGRLHNTDKGGVGEEYGRVWICADCVVDMVEAIQRYDEDVARELAETAVTRHWEDG